MPDRIPPGSPFNARCRRIFLGWCWDVSEESHWQSLLDTPPLWSVIVFVLAGISVELE